jgi:cystathionine gamma-synthase
LMAGDRFFALFCGFPTNPVLESPDLRRIKALSDRFGFPIVVDDTLSTSVNVDLLRFADVICSSLTKAFSGKCHVMGGR